MAHEWARGVLDASSWHGLENVEAMPDAAAMIEAGERSGAWPIEITKEQLATPGGLVAPKLGVVARYRDPHPSAVLGVTAKGYRATAPEEWRDLVRAAVLAGGRPTGAFSLRAGERVLATFEIANSSAIRSYLNLVDSFDGSLHLQAGLTSIRTVCANTLAVSFGRDGQGYAKVRHTASLEEKVKALREGITAALQTGEAVRKTFAEAERTVLTPAAAQRAFDLLFPKADEDASPLAKTRADNERIGAALAATHAVNKVGAQPGNLATLWNAATYLVDRRPNGSPRPARGEADRLDSLLFGARAKRVQEIQTLIEVIMRDGSIQTMTAKQALDAGVNPTTVGKTILDDMLGGA